MTKRKPSKPLVKTILIKTLTGFMVLVLVALFYLAVIMGQPTQEVAQSAAQTPQPYQKLSAQPAQQVTDESQLESLLNQFPAPALKFLSNPGLIFLNAQIYDLAYEGAFARIIEINYQTQNGEKVCLKSIYPHEAYTLLGRDGYALKSGTTISLGGQTAVRMESAQSLRFHVEGSEAIYALTTPYLSDDDLVTIGRMLQI